MGYSKLFDSMWSGSLHGQFEASAVFMVMLSLSDQHGNVDMSQEAIAGRTGWPIGFIKEGIAQLESPDTRSRTPDADGRRIIRLDDHRDWGWMITNYEKYRDLERSVERREYLRQAKRKEREARRQQVSTDVNRSTPHMQSRSEQIIPPAAAQPEWFDQFKAVYPKRAGSQPWPRARKAANARLKEGHTTAEFIAGAERYAAFCNATGKLNTEFVMQAATFLGPDKQFMQPWPLPMTPALKAAVARAEADRVAFADLKVRASNIGFRQPTEGEDLIGYRTLVERAEYNAKMSAPRSGSAKPIAELLNGSKK